MGNEGGARQVGAGKEELEFNRSWCYREGGKEALGEAATVSRTRAESGTGEGVGRSEEEGFKKLKTTRKEDLKRYQAWCGGKSGLSLNRLSSWIMQRKIIRKKLFYIVLYHWTVCLWMWHCSQTELHESLISLDYVSSPSFLHQSLIKCLICAEHSAWDSVTV